MNLFYPVYFVVTLYKNLNYMHKIVEIAILRDLRMR